MALDGTAHPGWCIKKPYVKTSNECEAGAPFYEIESETTYNFLSEHLFAFLSSILYVKQRILYKV